MTDCPFFIEGADRPGRWVISCDHASNRVPEQINGGSLGLPDQDMARHIAYDVGALGVAQALGRLLDAPMVASNFSRLVIDPNRGTDDPTLIMQLYDGTLIPANKGVDADERQRRIEAYHAPYHTAIDTHALQHNRLNALIELRNDLIETPAQQMAWAERLAPILQTALEKCET